jgi:hypothetical protein
MQDTENFLRVLGKHVHPLFSPVRASRSSQIRVVPPPPKLNVRHSELSMDKSIRMARKLKRIFAPNRMMFKNLKGKKKYRQSQFMCKEKKCTKNNKMLFLGAVNFSQFFLVLPVSWELNPTKS